MVESTNLAQYKSLSQTWLVGVFCESWLFSSAVDVGPPQVAGANCVYLHLESLLTINGMVLQEIFCLVGMLPRIGQSSVV